MRTLTSILLALLAATASASITGTVLDDEGKPIAGATVRAWTAETSRVYRQRLISTQPETEPFATATTDDAGAFSVDTKGTVAVDLRVEKAGRQPAAVEAVDGDEPLTLVLRPAPTRKVRVTAAGKAVAGALVLFGPHLMARTDAAGEAPLLDDTVSWVVHPDYAIARPTATFGTTSSVALQKGVALRGRVVNAKGAGVKADLFIGGMPAGSSGDDGGFTIPRAPSNWTSIRAVAGKEAAVAVRARAPQIELRLGPARTVAGMVREDVGGRPVAGARVTLGTNGDSDGYDVALSDAKGNFAFDGVAPRDYSLNARHPAYLIQQQQIPAGETSSRSLTARPMARVRGRVIDEARKPVAGAVMTSSSTGPSARPSGVTDAAGNFSLRLPAAPMPIAVSATRRGYAAGASPRRRLKDGEVVDDVVITLRRGFPLQVRIVDRRHQPVAGVMVYAGSDEEAGRVLAACEDPFRDNCRLTGADGSVAFRIVEGLYTLSVIPYGDDKSIAPKLLAAQQLSARSSPLVVEVDAGVAVSGKVAYADGTLVLDTTIEIRGGMMGFRREPAPDGTFSITGLAPGKVTLIAATADGNLSTAIQEVTAPAANVVLIMSRGGRIEGRVVERSTLRPVTDFTVAPNRREQFAPRPPGATRETHSDDGSFVLDNVAPGPTTVRVTARGFVPGTRADIQVEEGRAVTGIEVQLERGAKLTGRVTADGKPVAGAVVRPVAVTASSISMSTTLTDGDGQYSLDGIPPGERTFEFRKQGFITRRQSAETAAGSDTRLDVDLERGRELRGRVTDKSGAGIEGASVSAFAPMSGGDNAQAVTTADGAFALEGLGETRYSVQVRKSGFASITERDVAIPQSTPLVITLDRGGTITGRVTGLSPSELGSVFVNANAEGSFASAQADSSGAFTLRGVPEGRVMVSANVMGSERRSRPKPVMVEGGSAPPVEINFEDGFTVRGRVAFNGIPTAAGSINFSPAVAKGDQGGFGRVSGGAYEINGLAAGEYNVNVNSPDGSWRGKYVVSGPGTFDIDVRGATLRGRVVNAESGAPVADASVGVSGKPPTGYSNVVSDSEGRFAVPALSDGKYTLAVQRETFAPSQQEVTVSGGAVPEVEVRLEGGTPTTFVIVDAATGTVLTGGNVFVDSGGKRVGNGVIRSEEGVRLWLQPGRYTAMGSAFGYATGPKTEFTVPGPAVRLSLSRAGTLVVVARTALFARLRSAGGYNRLLRLQEGTFGQLPAGEYTMEVLDDKQEQVVKRLPVLIVAGEKTTVTVD